MWCTNVLHLKITTDVVKLVSQRFLSTTRIYDLNQKWRRARGLPLNPNACGALTDGADYTFLDGRPTPYGVSQRERILKQRELAEEIIKLTSEVDYAVDRHKQKLLDEEARRKEILDNKLKPKGVELLKSKKNS